MANDIFTGGAAGSPINWAEPDSWSQFGPPGPLGIAEESGAGILSEGDSWTIGGLVLDSDSSLTIAAATTLDVAGVGDGAFGGAGGSLDIAGTLDVSAGASAAGAVTVESTGNYSYDGSGGAQTVDVLGQFSTGGSNNADDVTVQAGGVYTGGGSALAGAVHLDGGQFIDESASATTTVDMSGGGQFTVEAPFSGLIESFGPSGAISVSDPTDSGTPGSYSVDTTDHTITFDFTTSSGTDATTLDFDAGSNLSNLYFTENSTTFTVLPQDVFTGATGAGSNTWSTLADWSIGATPGTGTVVEQSGAGTMDLAGAVQIEALNLDSGASLTIPHGNSLEVTGAYPFGGAGSALDVAGILTLGAAVTGGTGAITVESGGEMVNYGSSFAGTVSVAGEYFDEGANNGGTITLEGGLFGIGGGPGSDGSNGAETINMIGGGTVSIETPFNGTIENFNHLGTLDVSVGNTLPAGYSINLASNSISFDTTGGTPFTIHFDPATTPVSALTVNQSFAVGEEWYSISSSVPVTCFVSGTLIRTKHGNVAVDALKVGELAVTSSGEARPIVWIGHGRVERPTRDECPIRIRAGAFGGDRPGRDLLLSPGHAVCVAHGTEEVFVPAWALVNGATIVREEVPTVTYWHVELESHDVILAEGLPCESYLDMGNRAFFGRAYGRLATVDPERATTAVYARPFIDQGPIVEAVRRTLAVRADALGWARERRADPELWVDGRRIEAEIEAGVADFRFCADAQDAVLVCETFSPLWSGVLDDSRELGLNLEALAVVDAEGEARRFEPDHPLLAEGFFAAEHHRDGARRWTGPRAVLPPALWAGMSGQVRLRLVFAAPIGWTWAAPEARRAA
jgi:hypothetical protein